MSASHTVDGPAAIDSRKTPAARQGRAALPSLLLRRLASWVAAQQRPWREDLLGYDSHLLRDIGLTRAEAERLAGLRR